MTRRPLSTSTTAIRSLPSHSTPSPSIQRPRPPSERCPSGTRPSASRRTSAPPGVAQLSATAAIGDTAVSTARRTAPGVAASISSTAGCSGSSPRRDSGLTPPASDAATIEPADDPTNAPDARGSTPASSSPASTPVIQASPRTPPTPRTSTSGGPRALAQHAGESGEQRVGELLAHRALLEPLYELREEALDHQPCSDR